MVTVSFSPNSWSYREAGTHDFEHRLFLLPEVARADAALGACGATRLPSACRDGRRAQASRSR